MERYKEELNEEKVFKISKELDQSVGKLYLESEEELFRKNHNYDIEFEMSQDGSISSLSSDDEGNNTLDKTLEYWAVWQFRQAIVGIVGQNGEILKEYRDVGTQYHKEAFEAWHDEQATQTHLSLVDPKYDFPLASNHIFDQIFKKHVIKSEQ